MTTMGSSASKMLGSRTVRTFFCLVSGIRNPSFLMIVDFCSFYGKLCTAGRRFSSGLPPFTFSVNALLSGQIRCNNTDIGNTARALERAMSAGGCRKRTNAVWAKQRLLMQPFQIFSGGTSRTNDFLAENFLYSLSVIRYILHDEASIKRLFL
ncbi:hypothetical protein SDC9_132358 [bioreactor metagenome]|uniref:Uncharacterized protein n=1 Tax=bioreactor metagenome TaxID=1076179 RepID=A0A645D6Y0_9ZZZZ